MISTISFIISLIFFVITIIGGTTHSFLVLTVAQSITNISFIVFTLSINKHSKNIRKEFRGAPMTMFRIVLLVFGLAYSIISTLYILDLPHYMNNNYHVTKGVPQKIQYAEPTKADPGGGYEVTLNGDMYKLNAGYEINELQNRQFEIYYLPYTNWIIKYKIKFGNEYKSFDY